MNVHLYNGQCQITLEEIRVGFLIMHDGVGYFEWLKCGKDARGRRKWRNMLFPGIWNWLENRLPVVDASASPQTGEHSSGDKSENVQCKPEVVG